jgi:hypothetical protein
MNLTVGIYIKKGKKVFQQEIGVLQVRGLYCWEREDRCNDCPVDYPDKICPGYKGRRKS